MVKSLFCSVQISKLCELKPTGCGHPTISDYVEYNILLVVYLAFFVLSLLHTIRRLAASKVSLVHSRLSTALFIQILLVSLCKF